MPDIVPLIRVAFQRSHLHFTLVTVALLAICIYFLMARFGRFWDQWQRKRHPPSPFVPGLLIYY
ncbi:MAG TPA: hypothetical protein VJ521_15145, partial [Acidobacteriota bacterium]|nr:hypothetical protein [Acidobacteriota bacterium]